MDARPTRRSPAPSVAATLVLVVLAGAGCPRRGAGIQPSTALFSPADIAYYRQYYSAEEVDRLTAGVRECLKQERVYVGPAPVFAPKPGDAPADTDVTDELRDTPDADEAEGPVPGDRTLRWAGARNVRDLGGLTTVTRRTVSPRRVIRAGALSALTDCTAYEAAAPKTVFDLRPAPAPAPAACVSRLSNVVSAPMIVDAVDPNLPDPVSERYRRLLTLNGDRVKALFEALADPANVPLVIADDGGVERAGVAAAVLLRALGVGAGDTAADYLLSTAEAGEIAPERRYIEAVFTALDESGGPDAYLATIGIGAQTLDAVRANLLTADPGDGADGDESDDDGAEADEAGDADEADDATSDAPEAADWWENTGRYYREWAYVPDTSVHGVAKLDLCTFRVVDQHLSSNPFVLTHIPVGKRPGPVAALPDGAGILVANTAEGTLSRIDTAYDQEVERPYKAGEPIESLVIGKNPAAPDDPASYFVYLTLPASRRIVRIGPGLGPEAPRVTRDLGTCDGPAGTAALPITPGDLAVSPAGDLLVVPDRTAPCLLLIDNPAAPDFAAAVETKLDAGAATTTAAVSPDGALMYVGKSGLPLVSVYAKRAIGWVRVDANPDTPGRPPGGATAPDATWDIRVRGVPTAVVFGLVGRVPDAVYDAAEADVEIDAAEADDDAPGDIEIIDGLVFERRAAPAPRLFAWVTTHNGTMTMIDATGADGIEGLHRPWDRRVYTDRPNRPDFRPGIAPVRGNPPDAATILTRDGFDAFLPRRTPTAEWQVRMNAPLPAFAQTSVAGRLDTSAAGEGVVRLYDPRVDFTSVGIEPRIDAQGVRRAYPGDAVIVVTPPETGCPLQVTQEATLALEVLRVGTGTASAVAPDTDFLELDVRRLAPDDQNLAVAGQLIGRCFTSSVEYRVRTNESGLVYARIEESSRFDLRGRALTRLVARDTPCTFDAAARPWSYSDADDFLRFVMCRAADPVDGALPPFVMPGGNPQVYQFEFAINSEVERLELFGARFRRVRLSRAVDPWVLVVDDGAPRIVVLDAVTDEARGIQ